MLTPLTFAITGLSKDKQVYSPVGTGFFVAPYTAITAAHVMHELWDQLEMPWHKGKYPRLTTEPAFFVAAVQQVDIRNPNLAAHWEITGAAPLAYTDIAFLHVVPRCPVSLAFPWPSAFPELQLLPPKRGSLLWSFGYPGATFKHKTGEAVIDLVIEPTLMWGEATGYFKHGRGSWSFPQFEVTMAFEPG